MAEKNFTIVHRRSRDYKIYASPVIYGGPTPDGRGVLINLCVDHSAFPSYIEHPVEQDGHVDTKVITNVVQVGNVEREIQAGIYLSLEDLERTVVWLNKLVDTLKGGKHE